MKASAERPQSAAAVRPSTASARSAVSVVKPPSQEAEVPLWGSLFRPSSATSNRRSFAASSLKHSMHRDQIDLSPGQTYSMGMFCSKSQRKLRAHFRPQAKINAYSMYVSAAFKPVDATARVTMSPQLFTEGELNSIRKAPSVDKMLKAAKRSPKEERDRTVRKEKVNTLKVPLLDYTESDEEREQEARELMKTLHLKFRTDCEEARTDTPRPSVSVTSTDSLSIEPLPARLTEPDDLFSPHSSVSPRAQTASLFKYDTRSSIPETDEDCGHVAETVSSARTTVPRFCLFENSGETHSDSLIPTLRVRPMSASTSARRTTKPGNFKIHQLTDPPLAPFGVRLKGGKVKGSATQGVMFRPARSEDTPHDWSFLPASVLKRNPGLLSKRH